MNIGVCIRVGEEDSAIIFVISKRVKDMGQLVCWDVLGEELPCVDVPVAEIANSAVAVAGCYVRGLWCLSSLRNGHDLPSRCCRGIGRIFLVCGCHLVHVSTLWACLSRDPTYGVPKVVEYRDVVFVADWGGGCEYDGLLPLFDPPWDYALSVDGAVPAWKVKRTYEKCV